MDKKIRLYLITGFLGAGKTTLLQNLLQQFADIKVGLIINEFGKLGIDGQLVKRNSIELLEINNGSIFCSCLKGSFIEGLVEFSKLPIDVLLVESSGLADPSNIGTILDCISKARGEVYYYCGSICIVDSCNLLKYMEVLPAISRQIELANLIVINKIDLIDEESLAAVEAKIRELNPQSGIVKASYCRFSYDFLKEYDKDIEVSGSRDTSNTIHNRPRILVLRAEGSFEAGELKAFLTAISPSCYRVKGFFYVEEYWHQVDVVGEQIVFKPTDIEQHTSNLVIISSAGDKIIKLVSEEWERIVKKKMTLRV